MDGLIDLKAIHYNLQPLFVHFWLVYKENIELDSQIKGSLTDGYFMAAVTSWAKNKLVNHDRVLHFNDNKLADNGCFKFRPVF